jgi:hypothetical protein
LIVQGPLSLLRGLEINKSKSERTLLTTVISFSDDTNTGNLSKLLECSSQILTRRFVIDVAHVDRSARRFRHLRWPDLTAESIEKNCGWERNENIFVFIRKTGNER